MILQHYSSSRSQGFKDEDLGNFPGWQAATVATYCTSRPSQLLATTLTKLCDKLDDQRHRKLLMVSLHPSNPKHNMAKPVPDVRGFVKRRIGLGRQRPSQQRQLSRQLGVLHHGIWTFARGINIHCVASPQSRCFAWFSFRSSVTNLAVQLLQYQPNSRWNIVKIALQIYHD